jgi:hypothetical protein
MDQEQEVVVETPVAEAPVETVAEPEVKADPEPKVDVKDRSAVIKDAVKKSAEARTNAAGRKIAPDGKYVPQKAAPQSPKGAPAGSAVAGQAPAVSAPVQAPTGVLVAPAGLTVAMKARWGSLPPEVQAELARLDKTAAEAAGKAAQPYAEKARAADELNAVIAPHLPMIQAEGGTPAKAIASLLQTAALLRTGSPQQKTHLFMQLASQYGVQLPQGQGQQAEGSQGLMPDIQSHPYVQQLAGMVQQLHGNFTQQQQAEQARLEKANSDAVSSFLTEADAKGQPKFPLEDSMQSDFASQIRLTREANPGWDARRVLEQAYDNLSWIHPSLRQLKLSKQEEERRAKEQQELAAKKAAAVSVKGSGPSSAGPSSIDPKDRRAVIKNNLGSLSRT